MLRKNRQRSLPLSLKWNLPVGMMLVRPLKKLVNPKLQKVRT